MTGWRRFGYALRGAATHVSITYAGGSLALAAVERLAGPEPARWWGLLVGASMAAALFVLDAEPRRRERG